MHEQKDNKPNHMQSGVYTGGKQMHFWHYTECLSWNTASNNSHFNSLDIYSTNKLQQLCNHYYLMHLLIVIIVHVDIVVGYGDLQ